MSNVLNVINLRNAKSDFKVLVIVAFCVVAMSFFAIGFVYAQAPGIGILVKLLALMGTVNIALVFYIIKKFNDLSTT